ncbi:MAG: hypothetical protein G3I11_01240 [Ferrovum sp.]|nr:hypothetical protein [Ferrovum sp.]
MNVQGSRRNLVIAAIISLASAGCSSVSVHDPLTVKPNEVVLVYYCIESTAQMNILDKTLTKGKNKDRFEENIKSSLVAIDEYLNANIVKSRSLIIKKIPSCQDLATTAPGIPNALYLTITLNGYGSLNGRWKKLFIGSGIIEGISQGIVVGVATHNPWLGIAMAMEEFGQEYLTWSGLDWLMGETYAPVTLEGKLVSATSQQAIWKDSSFVTENSDELDKMSKAEKKKKEVQLKASLHKTEKELVTSLNTYLTKEILNATQQEKSSP